MRLAVVFLAGLTSLAAAASFEADFQSAQQGLRSLATPPAVVAPQQDELEDVEAEAEEGVPGDLLTEAVRWNTSAQLARISAPLADTLRFAVIGDAEPGRFFWSRILFGKKGVFAEQLRRLGDEDAAFVVQLGDMVSRGIPRHYRRFYGEINGADLPHPYLTAIGNHDRRWPHGDVDADLYEALFGPRDYSFDVGQARFVVVDTSLERLTEGQLAWLDLALRTDKRKFVFTHMPPAQFKAWTVGMTGIKEGGERFVELMAARRVDRVYLGHIHGYGIAQKDGVRYVLSGGGGSPLYLLPTRAPKLFYHYLTVELTPDGVSETVHPLQGAAFAIPWPQEKKDFELLFAGGPAFEAHLH